MMNQLKGIFKSNQFKLILLRSLGVGLLFLATLVMTNYYDQSIVGEFEFIRSMLLLLGSLVLLGTDRSILQFAGQLVSANRMTEFIGLYKKVITVFLILTLILFILYFIIPSNFVEVDLTDNNILKTIATLFFYAVALFNTEVFRVFDKNNWSETYRGIFKYIILFIASIGFLYLEITHLIVDAFLISFVLLALVSSVHLKVLFPQKNTTSRYSYKEIISTSFPMALSSLGFFLLLSIDILLLKYYVGDDLIAIYAQPVKIIALIAMIQTTLQASIAKNIAAFYYANDIKSLSKIVKRYTRLIALISIPFLIIFLLLPETILSFFGADYTSGSYVLLILLSGTLINAICGCTSVYMNMTGKQVQFRNIIFITIIVNLILNIILIPLYGIEGAAVASAFSLILWNIVTVIYVYIKERILLILH